MNTHTSTPQSSHPMSGHRRFSTMIQLTFALVAIAVANVVHADPASDNTTDLEITAIVSDATAQTGDTVTFTLTATNRGPAPATGVKVFHRPADGFVYQSDNSNDYDPSDGIWNIGDLSVDQSVALEIVATVGAGGNFGNDATIFGAEQDTNAANNIARFGIRDADLELGMSLSDDEAVAGDPVVLTLTVSNNGPHDAHDVRVESRLPSGYLYQNDDSSGSYDPATGIWSIGTLADQAQAALQIEAIVQADGAHLNMASVQSGNHDPVYENNHAMAAVGGNDGPTTVDSGDFIPRSPDDALEAEGNPNLPIVNGLFHGDGDHQRYVLLTTSDNGSRLYGYFDTNSGRYYAALVVSRHVNDNVFGNREYTTNAGWTPAHTFKRTTDSEYMKFTLTCGNQSWTWQQGYCAQPGGTTDLSSPNWQSSHLVGAGSGTPPPGYESASSLAWNLNHHALGGVNSWDVSQNGTLDYNDWKSPFDPSSPDTVIGLDGYPATGEIGFSETHGWEWAMVYEFSVDLSGLGPHPVRLSNIGSHHSPAKSGGEDDPIEISGPLLDWGDLPAPYPTTAADNGPRHETVSGGAYLGNLPPDMEVDGQPDTAARGDDKNGIDDEDGVRFLSIPEAGKLTEIEVIAGTAGYLSAWMDFTGGGTLTQLSAVSIIGPAPVAGGLIGDLHLPQPGVYVFTVQLPANAAGLLPSRWRFTNEAGQGGNSITGLAINGEVEDHRYPQACPDRWDDWQDKWDGPLAGDIDPYANPDLDRYRNVIEYAFCMPPHSGVRKPFCLSPSATVEGAVDGVYTRTAIGGAKDVTYILEWAPQLGNPTVWTGSTVLDGSNTYVTNPVSGKEIVRIPDLETLTGLTGGSGFVRIRVILDNGVVNAEDATDVLGWHATDLDPHCQSYNNPFLACAVFTGTVDAIDGQDAVFATSAGPFDLASVLDPAYSYFIEVESGDLEGHRFNLDVGAGNALSLVEDTTAYADGIQTNAVPASLPVELLGDRIAVHRHRTINDLFPPTGFAATTSRSSADKVRVYAGGQWSDYWLYSNSGSPVWLKAGVNSLDDQGITPVPPGQGVMFDSQQTTASILAYGEVRQNRFVRPLDSGHSFVGGGFPMDQSANGANGRNMNAGTGFLATNDFKTADTFFFWNGDFEPGARGYTSYYLLNGSRTNPDLRWVKFGDVWLNSSDEETLLHGDRAVFIRSKNGLGLHTMPLPWSP